LSSNKLENEKIESIIYFLNEIKKIDIEEYNNMNNLLDYYYKIILYKNNENNLILLRNFFEIKVKKENIKNKEYSRSLIYLKNIFHTYDFSKTENINVNFNTFINEYLISLNILVTEKNIIVQNKENKKILESLANFIEDYIKIDSS
jgi:hypothetical protein